MHTYYLWLQKTVNTILLILSTIFLKISIHEKSEAPDMFKRHKANVKNQLNKRTKDIKSGRGAESYGSLDGLGGRFPGSFEKYLEVCGIVRQT